MLEGTRVGDGSGADASDEQQGGISRRTLIRRAAAMGAVAWAAPTIIQSLTSPAAAVTGGFLCSYAMVVFTTPTGAINVVKIEQGMTTCTLTDATSSDGVGFSDSCNDGTASAPHTYAGGAGAAITRDGGAITVSGTCPFTINGNTVTANAGHTIRYVKVHDGACSTGCSGPGTCHFCPQICAPGQSFTGNCGK